MDASALGRGLRESVTQKADRIADRIRAKVNCDMVLVSVDTADELVSLGMAAHPEKAPSSRRHKKADTVCAETISRCGMVVVEDARLEPELCDLSYVKSGAIISYLGCPIRDSEGHCYGALCAASSAPRTWTEADMEIVEAAACEAASLFAVEQLRIEISGLHRDLDHADRALMTLSNSMTALVSIHNLDAELIFATSNLRTTFSEHSLILAIREALQTSDVTNQLGTPKDGEDEPIARVRNLIVKNTKGNRVAVSAQIRRSASETFYVYWKNGNSQRLN